LAEAILKIISLGFQNYLRDKINIFDFILVLISMLMLVNSDNKSSSFSAFRALRLFKALKALRVTRLIRSLKYMNVIIKVLSGTFYSAISIFFLLVLFIFIYSILGLSLFQNKLNKTNGKYKEYRFGF